MKILLIGGPLAVGKTAIASELVDTYGFHRIRSGGYLLKLAQESGADQSRGGLQNLGDRLDVETDHRWLIDDVARPTISSNPGVSFWLLDCVRKERQVRHFRDSFGSDVRHIHFVASEEILRARYAERMKAGGEYLGNTSYDEAITHPNEIASRGLSLLADDVVEVEQKTKEEIAREVVGKLVGGKNAPSGCD